MRGRMTGSGWRLMVAMAFGVAIVGAEILVGLAGGEVAAASNASMTSGKATLAGVTFASKSRAAITELQLNHDGGKPEPVPPSDHAR